MHAMAASSSSSLRQEQQHDAPVGTLPRPCAVTDAELYRYAVDMSDIDAILRHPQLPPFFVDDRRSDSDGRNDTQQQQQQHLQLPPQPPMTSTCEQQAVARLTFECITHDADYGIALYSTPVEGCAVRMMCARAIMPCTPAALLQYMQSDVRPQWDRHTLHSRLLRELSPPPASASSSTSTSCGDDKSSDSGAAVTPRRCVGCATRVHDLTLSKALLLHPLHAKRQALSLGALCTTTNAAVVSPTPPQTVNRNVAQTKHSNSLNDMDDSSHAATSSSSSFAFAPGQCRVALHYLGIRSPLLLVQDRDFELVVCERVQRDGMAYLKAFSAPPGYAVPLDPMQTRYVRAIAFLAAVVARPLTRNEYDNNDNSNDNDDSGCDVRAAAATGLPPSLRRHARRTTTVTHGTATHTPPHAYCVMTYLGLIHPMGLLPPVVADFVTNAQVSTLRSLQRYILQHPIAAPAHAASAHDDRHAVAATTTPHGKSSNNVAGGSGTAAEMRWFRDMRSRL